MNEILKVILSLQFATIFVWTTFAAVARYDNYRLYQVMPNNDEHLKLLNDIESSSDSYIFLMGPRMVNAIVAVIVAPHKFADFGAMLDEENISFDIVVEDVQNLIDAESLLQSRISEDFGWKKYYPLEDIYKWMDVMLGQYPNVTSAIIAGKSHQERDIKGVKMSYKSGNPGIFIEGGIHAREWISPAVATFLLNTLLSSKNESIRSIAENFDWYIVPNTNPDGYVYTHTSNRLWRKTRKRYSSNCYGADPNRNWDFHFGEAGASENPCSQTYPGPEAFSEIEMKTYASYLKSLKDQIQTFISLHAYSQLLLFPYGHTSKKADNFDDLLDIGNRTIIALARRYNTKYRVGNVHDTIYPASGSSMDWVYEKLKVPISYTYELRPANRFPGFELPASEIIPTALETVESIVEMLKHSERLGYYKRDDH